MGWKATAGLKLTPATILSGQTVSNPIDLLGEVPVGFHMPTTFTGTTLTFQAATALGGTYRQVQDENGDTVSVTVAGNRFVQIPPTLLCGVQYLKIVSGTTEGGDRVVTVAGRPY